MTKLTDVMDMKAELERLEAQISAIRQEQGLPALEEQVKILKFGISTLLTELVDTGITQEGSLRIVNKGRKVRKINLGRLHAYDPVLYDVLETKFTLSLKELDVVLADREDKDTIIDMLCDTTQSENWDVVDLLAGD